MPSVRLIKSSERLIKSSVRVIMSSERLIMSSERLKSSERLIMSSRRVIMSCERLTCTMSWERLSKLSRRLSMVAFNVSRSPYLDFHLSEGIHTWTLCTL